MNLYFVKLVFTGYVTSVQEGYSEEEAKQLALDHDYDSVDIEGFLVTDNPLKEYYSPVLVSCVINDSYEYENDSELTSYEVKVPVSGIASIEVKASTEEEALLLAKIFSLYDYEIEEFEVYKTLSVNSVFCGYTNSPEIIILKEDILDESFYYSD